MVEIGAWIYPACSVFAARIVMLVTEARLKQLCSVVVHGKHSPATEVRLLAH